MNSDVLHRLLAAGVLLAATGFFNAAGRHRQDDRSAESRSTMTPLAVGMLADAFWLRTNTAWERHDVETVRELSAICTALVPGDDYFRGNAARMRAYDFPAWQIERRPGAPIALRRQWRTAAAQEALQLLLEKAPPSTAALLDAGAIALYGLESRTLAAAYFRRAAEQPDAPWHAGRICAELLHQAGRTREAVEWLRAWLPRLPAHDPLAQRERMAARLAEWERELAMR